jgi:hypothetical protein
VSEGPIPGETVTALGPCGALLARNVDEAMRF